MYPKELTKFFKLKETVCLLIPRRDLKSWANTLLLSLHLAAPLILYILLRHQMLASGVTLEERQSPL